MRRILLTIFVVLVSAFVATGITLWIAKRPHSLTSERTDALEFIRDVLKLGVVEVRLSQIYEVKRDNLTVSNIPIPWTGQKSVITVRGSALAGYDLDQVEMTSRPDSKEVVVKLPPVSILTIDLDFDVIHEEDTFLNRLTPDDRNQIQRHLKQEVARTILTEKLKSQVCGIL